MGPLSVSPMGFGTWAWGNQLLWGYQTSMDDQLQQAFELALQNGINLFDTADSYGTGRLNGQSERLLGKFIKDSQGMSLTLSLISPNLVSAQIIGLTDLKFLCIRFSEKFAFSWF